MKKDTKIISDKVATVNQILPHVNKWAWDLFIDGAANNWMPTEIERIQICDRPRVPTVHFKTGL